MVGWCLLVVQFGQSHARRIAEAQLVGELLGRAEVGLSERDAREHAVRIVHRIVDHIVFVGKAFLYLNKI